MTDDDLEATLRRYRIRPPAAALRSRVLEGVARTVPLTWFDGGMVAAAAVLVFATLWPGAAPIALEPSAADIAWEGDVRVVAALMGGDDAYELAQSMVPKPVEERSAPVEEE
jgi:hypothetical protein